jgi:tripartite-type tricarboxylate transporter receptor subunit TctC
MPISCPILAALLFCLAAFPAFAFPERPVQIVVSVAPGAGPDVIARLLAERLGQAWGQQVLVVNRPGAGGVLAAQAVAQAQPDGHTLFMAVGSIFVTLPESRTRPPLDLNADFASVGLVAEQPMAFAVTPKLGVGTLAELAALSRRRPGEILYGATRGSVPHMTGELFQMRSGAQLGYVPTVGAAKVIQDIMSGNLAVVVDSMPGLVPGLQSGAVKALAVASDQRLPSHPDIPLVSETLPDFVAKGWFVLMAPARTPEPVLRRISADLRQAQNDPALQKRLEAIGTFARPLSPEDTAAYIKAEQHLWRPVVRKLAAE